MADIDRAGSGARERAPYLSLAVVPVALVLLAALMMAAPKLTFLQRWEHSTADMRTALFSDHRADLHPNFALVKITDASLPTTPIDRAFLADLVAAVDRAEPRAIGLDVFFRRPTTEAKDKLLAQALKSAKADVVLAAWDERGMDVEAQRQYQAAFIASTGRRAGFINLRHERDGIVRLAAEPATGSRYPDSFAHLLAKTVSPNVEARYERIAWLQRVDTRNPVAHIVNIDGTSPFAEVAAVDLLGPDGARFAPLLRGKVVLIGVDLKVSADNHRTPLSVWTGVLMPGVAIHAQMAAQMVDGRRVSELGAGTPSIVLMFILATLGAAAGWRFRYRKYDFLSWGTAAAVLVGVDALVFKALNFILPFLLCMIAWFGGVTLGHHGGRTLDWLSRRRQVEP